MLTIALLSSLPVFAIGTIGPVSSNDKPVVGRAVFMRDGDSTAVALQLDPHAESVTTWVLPLPGGLELAPTVPPAPDGTSSMLNVSSLNDDGVESLLMVTDPIYQSNAEAGAGCGCMEGIGDTGEGSETRQFDKPVEFDRSNGQIFGPDEAEDALQAIADSGVQLSDQQMDVVKGYADNNWHFMVVSNGESVPFDRSLPLLGYRYSGTEVVVPMALSADNGGDHMQIAVVIFDQGRVDPVTSKGTQPRLGQPMYRSAFTRRYYNARLKVAIEEAGGHAWVLEYANTLEQVKLRADEFTGSYLPTSVDQLLEDTKDAGLLSDDFGFNGLFVTRWRTFITPENMADELFGPAKTNDTYEVTLLAEDFEAVSSTAILAPIFLLGWAYRRRQGL